MRIELEIKKAEVILNSGPDVVILTTNKPSTFPIGHPDLELKLKFETRPGYGAEYCKENFDIFPDIINMRTIGMDMRDR